MTRREQIKQLWDAADRFIDFDTIMKSAEIHQARKLDAIISREAGPHIANWLSQLI
jgi:hypothetical protein